MTNTGIQQTSHIGSTEPFEKQLEAKILQGLDLAIQNAVNAQQQLYVLGQAALAEALKERAGSREDSAKPEVSDTQSPSMEELARRLRGIAETGNKPGTKESASPADPASSTSCLMTAFAEALAMLNAVNVQQMLGYVLVFLSSKLEFDKNPGPITARVWVDLLTNNQLVELLVALKAASGELKPADAERK